MSTLTPARRKRASTQPSRVMLEAQNNLRALMASAPPNALRQGEDDHKDEDHEEDGDTSSYAVGQRGSACSSTARDSVSMARDSVTFSEEQRRSTVDGKAGEQNGAASLDASLRERLDLIDQKLDRLSASVSRKFDKLAYEVARTRDPICGRPSLMVKTPSQTAPTPWVSSQPSITSAGPPSRVPTKQNPMTPPPPPFQKEEEGAENQPHLSPRDSSGHFSPPADPLVQPPALAHLDPQQTAERTSGNAMGNTVSHRSLSPAAGIGEVVHAVVFNFASDENPLKRVLWEILEDPESSNAARMYRKFEAILIMVSVGGSLAKTMDPPVMPIETIITCLLCLDAFFLLELLLRYTICHSTRLFLSSTSNVIDMMAGAFSFGLNTPCLSGAWECTGDSLVAMTLIVVMPLLRLMKSLRHFHQFHLFLNFAYDISEALVVLMLLLGMIVLLFASVVYIVEPRDNIPTMPMAMYFIVTTVSTVGYGDYSPTTTIGYFVVSIVIMVSIMFMALPLGIIGNSFSQIWAQRDHVQLVRRIKDRLKQWGYTAGDMEQLVAYFDKDSDGNLELQEFVLMIEGMGISVKHEKVVSLFESFDVDMRDAVDARNLTRILFPGKYHELYPSALAGRTQVAAIPWFQRRSSSASMGSQYTRSSFTNIFRASHRNSAVIPENQSPGSGRNSGASRDSGRDNTTSVQRARSE